MGGRGASIRRMDGGGLRRRPRLILGSVFPCWNTHRISHNARNKPGYTAVADNYPNGRSPTVAPASPLAQETALVSSGPKRSARADRSLARSLQINWQAARMGGRLSRGGVGSTFL